MSDMVVVEELADGGFHLGSLAVAGACTRIVDDGAAAGDYRRVLNEAGIGVLFQRRQNGNLNAALLQRLDIGIVLLDGLFVNGLPSSGALVMPSHSDLPGRRTITWENLATIEPLSKLINSRHERRYSNFIILVLGAGMRQQASQRGPAQSRRFAEHAGVAHCTA